MINVIFLIGAFVLLCTQLAATPYSAPAQTRSTLDLSGPGWKFAASNPAGAEATTYNDSDWDDVSVPHTWNVSDGADGGSYRRAPSWYRRTFTLPATAAGQRVYIQFDGACLVATVFLNGQLVGEHLGGYTGFVFDLTPFLIPESTNVLAVKVDNTRRTDVAPLSGDFTIFGGIHRAVRLLLIDPIGIDPLDYGSPGIQLITTNVSAANATLEVIAKVRNDSNDSADIIVQAQLVDASGEVVQLLTTTATLATGARQSVSLTTTVPSPHLWKGRADPYLYQVYTEVINNGVVRDHLGQPVGFRSYKVDRNGGFSLNGLGYDLRGASLHESREGKGSAISDADRVEDLAFLAEMGATFVRLAHYPHAPAIYDEADRLGLLVWTEIPYVNEGTGPEFQSNISDQLRELIRQNINHPSIITWGLQNECNNIADVRTILSALNTLAHSEDPTRLTTQASILSGTTVLDNTTDLLAMNRYFGWYYGQASDFSGSFDSLHNNSTLTHPLGVSEYGAGANPTQHEENPAIPVTTGPWHPEEYQTLFHESHWQQMRTRPYLWCKTVWNLFDFASDGRNEGSTPGMNDKGLVTYNRLLRKDAFYYYKANWAKTPFVHITSSRFTTRTNPITTVKAYSTGASVELFLNGVSLGTRSPDAEHRFYWPLTLRYGNNELEARTVIGGTTYSHTVNWDFNTSLIDVGIESPVDGTARLSTPGTLWLNGVVTTFADAPTNGITMAWTLLTGPASVTIDTPTARSTLVTFDTSGLYTLRFTAVDGLISYSSDVLVNVGIGGGIPSSPKAAWSFNEGVGTTTSDSSGNNRLASLSNVNWTSSPYLFGAGSFNGNTSRAVFNITDTPQITIAAWIRSTNKGNSNFPRIIELCGYWFMVRHEPTRLRCLSFASDRSTVDAEWCSPTNLIADNSWYHVAVTYDRSVPDAVPVFYFNGNIVASNTINTGSGNVVFLIGNYIGNTYDYTRGWNGALDEVRIYGRILSPQDISKLAAFNYNTNFVPMVSVSSSGNALVNQPYTLTGLISDATATTARWIVLSGPANVTFSPPDAATTQALFTQAGTYRLALLADDLKTVGAATIDIIVSTAFDTWTAAQSWPDPVATTSATTADPDSDGISNLLEYAFALDPLLPSVLPVTVSNSTVSCTLSYLRARSDINYSVETSATLAPNSWTTNEVTQDTTTPVGSTATATVIIDPTTNPQRFLRLKISD